MFIDEILRTELQPDVEVRDRVVMDVDVLRGHVHSPGRLELKRPSVPAQILDRTVGNQEAVARGGSHPDASRGPVATVQSYPQGEHLGGVAGGGQEKDKGGGGDRGRVLERQIHHAYGS